MDRHVSDQAVLRAFEVTTNPGLILDVTTAACPVIRTNAALDSLLGIERDGALGRPCLETLRIEPGFGDIDFTVAGDVVLQCRGNRPEPFWCRLEIRPIPDGDGTVAHSYCTLHDISEQVALHNDRAYFARHDPLTGLARAHVLEERLAAELLRSVHACSRVIVCYAGIDRIGMINEICSLAVGDELLRAIADRLIAIADDIGLVSRIGSNKFVLAFVDQGADVDQLEIGQRVAAALEQPLIAGDLSLRMTASIGVACFPDSATDVQELMQQAAAAARGVQRSGGDDVQVFVPTEREVLNTRLCLGSRLRGAVDRGEMILHYQPVIGTAKREVVGMEALVRWQSHDLGLVMPDQFIPLAEDFGMIAEIGHWVLQEACMQARRWLDQGVGDFTLSVNVSGLQTRGRQLLEDVIHALDAARLPARCLDLELTETAIMANLEHVDALLGELRKLGVKVSLDDFGVGQSSLGHLQRLQVNRLKIDRSFVAAVPDDVKATRICRAVIGLAHEFGFSVVAEGVETAVQLAFLERNGCEFAQGYLISPPVTADVMLGMLREPMLRPHEATDGKGAGSGTVLLVDDEQNVLRALARLLRRDGYRIVTANTFREAFEILGTDDVQVVMSDHRMPDGKGTEFLGRVKVTHPQTVRLILSGYADVGAVTEAMNGGAVHRFLTKPWDDDALRESVREAMRMAKPGDDSGP